MASQKGTLLSYFPRVLQHQQNHKLKPESKECDAQTESARELEERISLQQQTTHPKTSNNCASVEASNSPSAVTTTKSLSGSPRSIRTSSDTLEQNAKTHSKSVVPDSDSDESESSLEDLADIIERKQVTCAPRTTDHSPRPKALQTPKTYQPSPPRKPKYKFDLKSLARQAQQEDASRTSLQRMEDLVEQQLHTSGTKASHFDALESVITNDDGAETSKVLKALQRTETATTDLKCYLFDGVVDDAKSHEEHLLTDEATAMARLLRNPSMWEQAISSGVLCDFVQLGSELSNSFASWALQQASKSQDPSRQQSLTNLLLAAPRTIKEYMMCEHVDMFFRELGCNDTAMNMKERLVPTTRRPLDYETRDWTRVESAIRAVGQLTCHAKDQVQDHCMLLLMRLCTDAIIQEKRFLLIAMQDSLVRLCCAMSEIAWKRHAQIALSSQYGSDDCILCLRILKCVPAVTPRLHDLRRKLAYIAFLGRSEVTPLKEDAFLDLSDVMDALQTDRFKIRGDTDYRRLSALIVALDIAIDNGQCTFNAASEDAELQFDVQIDEICGVLKGIHSSIHDAGAKYMSRIDAKETLEGVQTRLLHVVRTRPPAKHGVFGLFGKERKDDVEQNNKQAKFMARFAKSSMAQETLILAEPLDALVVDRTT